MFGQRPHREERVGSRAGAEAWPEGRRGGARHPNTHRGDQWGSLTTASMLRAPQHWAGLPGGWRRPVQTQATRHGSIHSAAVRSHALTKAGAEQSQEAVAGVKALPCPLWPLLGVGGWCAPPPPGISLAGSLPASVTTIISVLLRAGPQAGRGRGRPACGRPGQMGAGRAVTEGSRGGCCTARPPPAPSLPLHQGPEAAWCLWPLSPSHQRGKLVPELSHRRSSLIPLATLRARGGHGRSPPGHA